MNKQQIKELIESAIILADYYIGCADEYPDDECEAAAKIVNALKEPNP